MITPPSAVRLRNAASVGVLVLLLSTGGTEGADCNRNCIDDADEIRGGTAPDCNWNGVPDDCDLVPESADFVIGPILAAGGAPRSLLVADVDGDGLPDVITGDWSEGTRRGSGVTLYFNSGAGELEQPMGHGVPACIPEALAIADLDRDGDLDLAMAVSASIEPCDLGSDRVSIIENLGGRIFASLASFEGGAGTSDLQATDIDRDGDVDLVGAGRGRGPDGPGEITVLRNRGDASYEPPLRRDLGDALPAGLAAGDLDGDGDEDLAVVYDDTTGFMNIFMNGGDGTFPPPLAIQVSPYLSSVAADDLDSDGDLDLVMSRPQAHAGVVLENLRAGSQWEMELVPEAGHPCAADIDGDGLRDLVATRYGGLQVFRNAGGGSFEEGATSAVLRRTAGLVASADMDGDGDDDVVTLGAENLCVVRNTGGELEAPLYVGGGAPVGAADFDEDGDIDLIRSHSLLLNSGTGVFPRMNWHGSGFSGRTISLAHGDLDGDGDLDLVVATFEDLAFQGGQLDILRNSGAGRFLASHQTLEAIDPRFSNIKIAIADVDGDGDLDLAAMLDRFQVSLLLNEGDGTFTRGGALIAGSEPSTIAAGDLDGDGLADLVTGNVKSLGFSSFSVFSSRGGGAFHPARNYAVGAEPTWLATGDIDRDGDLDVVTNGIHVLENAGDGTFEIRRVHDAEACSGVLADLDGDGDLDIAAGSSTLLINRADGSFDHRERTSEADGCFLLGADLDGDGNAELVEGQGSITVARNAGGASFPAPLTVPLVGAAQILGIVDHDGDGDLDMALGGHSHLGFLEATGPGLFERFRWRRLSPGLRVVKMASGDFDRDGRLDAVISGYTCDGNAECRTSLFTLLDRGEAPPVEKDLDGGALPLAGMDVADLDGDGDLDIIAVKSGCLSQCITAASIFLNDGLGGFSARHLGEVTGTIAASCAAVDLDGDLDLDIVTDAVSVYWNLGGAVFDEPVLVAHACCGLVVGDLDGDADVDLVTGAALLRNRGEGSFDLVPHRTELEGVAGPADLDGDGDGDVVAWTLTPTGDARLSLHLNDGASRLEAAGSLPSASGWPRFLEARDLDGDGRPDLVESAVGGVIVHWNLVRGAILPAEGRDVDSDGYIDGCQSARFTRGDATGDGAVGMADPIAILLHLFRGGPEPGCAEAADVNNDVTIDLADALQLLLHLFQGGPPPVPPGPDEPCERDTDADGVGCEEYSAC